MSIESAKFIVQRGAKQFKCQGDQLKDKLEGGDLMVVQRDNEDQASKWEVEGSMPWEDWDGGVWHVLNATATVNLSNGPYRAWDRNGKNETTISSFGVGDEFVFVTPPDSNSLFYDNSIPNWEFGEYTNVSNVTNMWFLFYGCAEFDNDISSWDVGKVKDMSFMFVDCINFTSDLSGWDTSSVENMALMFQRCYEFNSDLPWATSNVTNMSKMFELAVIFDGDVSGFDTTNVTNMSSMFYNCERFSKDTSNWDVSNVTNMSRMFHVADSFNVDISGWNVSNVRNMASLFSYCDTFNQDLSQWCVSQISSAPNYFDVDCVQWTLPRPVWGTCPRGEDQ